MVERFIKPLLNILFLLKLMYVPPITASKLFKVTCIIGDTWDEMIDNTKKAAEAGSKIILWSETGTNQLATTSHSYQH